MSANVILVIVGIVLMLLALGISIWVFVLPMLTPHRLKRSLPLRSDVLASNAKKTGWYPISGPLFWKYVGLFLAVVCVVLLSNGLFEIFFFYREHTESLVRIQREQAEGAAEKISQFIKEINNRWARRRS
jgi:hypothetical protein